VKLSIFQKISAAESTAETSVMKIAHNITRFHKHSLNQRKQQLHIVVDSLHKS